MGALLSRLDSVVAEKQARAMAEGVTVDLTRPAPSPWRFRLCVAGCLALLVGAVGNGSKQPLALLLLLAFGLCSFLTFRYRAYLRADNPLRFKLACFLRDNKLFEEEKQTDDNGHEVVSVVSSVRMDAARDADGITVRVYDDANRFSKRVRDLDALLSALFGLPLDSKRVTVTDCTYYFRTAPDTRIDAAERLSRDCYTCNPDSIPLSSGTSWRFAKCPHMLVCGGTGGGKSTFLYWLVASALQLHDGHGGGAGEVFVCDPKNAELGSLSRVFGKDHVGTTPAQIAGVVRRCRELMDARYSYMQAPERFRFGASAFDYGLHPVFLVFDEVAGFKAAADKKTFAEVWDNLTQLILKARAANVFVVLALQQPRAEVISTDVRDNLGARVSLGDLSAEGYRMCFGSADFTPESVTGRGAGYLMLDGWNAPKPYAAPWVDFSKVDFFEVFQRLHKAAEARRNDPMDTDTGDGGKTA